MFYTLKLQKNYFPTDQNTRITKEKKIIKGFRNLCMMGTKKRQ